MISNQITKFQIKSK